MATNPGGLGFLDQPSLELNLDGGFVRATYTDRFGDRSTLHENAFLPDAALAFPLGRGFTLGVGAAFDSGVKADWHFRDLPGGLDGGTSYGDRQHLSEIEVGRLGAAIAWQPSPQFSLGASVNAIWNRNRLDAPYTFQSQPVLRTAKVLFDLETEGWGVNADFGAVWKVNDAVKIGLAYHSEATVDTHGSAFADAGLQFKRVGLGAAQPTAHYNAEVTNVFPQTAELGVEWHATKRLILSAAVEWTNYERTFDTLVVKLTNGTNPDLNGLVHGKGLQDNVPLHWSDVWTVKFGAEYALTDEWTARLGYAWSQSPVPQETLTPLTAEIPEHTISAGLGWKRGPWTVDLGWQWQLPRSVTIDRTTLATDEYLDSTTHVGIHWIGLTAERKF